MPLTVSNAGIERILQEFKDSSDRMSRRIFWLTVVLVFLTGVLVVLTFWLIVVKS